MAMAEMIPHMKIPRKTTAMMTTTVDDDPAPCASRVTIGGRRMVSRDVPIPSIMAPHLPQKLASKATADPHRGHEGPPVGAVPAVTVNGAPHPVQ
jgi:hypothetical protein